MKILIVDDSKVSIKRLNRVYSGYGECHLANDGREAFAMFLDAHYKGNPFSILSMDINMSDWNGDQAIEAIRTFEISYKKEMSRILVLSSYLNPKLAVKLFKAGCCYCLSKPRIDEELKKVFEEIKDNNVKVDSVEEMVKYNKSLLED